MEWEKWRSGYPGESVKGRAVLFEGNGSFQMTAQAVSDIIRNRLDVIIFLINNDGSTMERVNNGMDAEYNDVQPWNYLESASYFGAPKDVHRIRCLRNGQTIVENFLRSSRIRN